MASKEIYYPLPASGQKYLISPTTGRVIEVGGPAYRGLTERGIVPEARPIPIEPEKGYSRHENEPEDTIYCGGVAGLNPTSYPVNSPGRARAAIARSGNAALHGGNPEIIKKCACNAARHYGWFDCHKADEQDPEGKYIPRFKNGKKAW